MDDDTLRRGRPTAHVVLRRGHGDPRRRRAADRGVRAAGARARRRRRSRPTSCTAQARRRSASSRTRPARPAWSAARRIDLQAAARRRGARSTRTALRDMHARKTGALIRASALAGAVMAGGRRRRSPTPSTRYAREVGLAFQIVDDILDVEGASADSARPPARMPPPASRPIPRCTASTSRGGWPPTASTRALAALAATPGSPGSCRRSRAGSSAARIEERRPPRRAARRARARRVARAGARADPRRRRARRRPAGHQGRHAPSPPTPRSRSTTPDHPYVGRGGLKLAHALDAFGIDVDRPRWRSTSAPRPAASPTCCCSAAPRASSRSTSATASSTGSSAATRASSCIERVNARTLDAPTICPPTLRRVRHRDDRRVVHLAAPHPAGRAAAARARRPTSSRWSSRSSRPGARRSARAGIVRDAAVHARVVDEVAAAADALGLTRAGLDRVADHRAWKATASSCCTCATRDDRR